MAHNLHDAGVSKHIGHWANLSVVPCDIGRGAA